MRTGEVTKEISRVRLSLRTLDKALERLAPVLNGDATTRKDPGNPATHVSAKVRSGRVLQDRYMGYMRQLKPSQKAQVRKIRDVKGVMAAIARAKRLSLL